jgi:RNA polymerase sigma factor (sigma-70 family)
LNRLRTIRRRRLVPLDETIPAERTDAPVRELERADLRARLLSALSRLAPIQREIVLLADVEHWSHDRIARATGVSVLMSRRHLSDARRRLRDLLSSSSLE